VCRHMGRLTKTKSDIEHPLLTGVVVAWQDANKKLSHLVLGDAKKRRLFAHLLQNKIRSPTGLSDEFVSGLAAAYDATDDPAATIAASPATGINSEPWRLQTVETEGSAD
jgi:hypothetical protein